MTTPRQNLQIVAQGLARLTSQFVSQPNIRAMLAVYLQPFQDLENAIWDVLHARVLATATVYTWPQTNTVFDSLGALVGQPRMGLPDADYKSLIYLRVAVNRATGAAPDWSRFGAILLRAGAQVIGFYGDQSGILFTVSNLPLNGILVAQILSAAVPNGQHGVFSFTNSPDGADFALGSVYDPTAGEQGYGSVYDATAGGGYSAGAAM